jgi:hypothetical protein
MKTLKENIYDLLHDMEQRKLLLKTQIKESKSIDDFEKAMKLNIELVTLSGVKRDIELKTKNQ